MLDHGFCFSPRVLAEWRVDDRGYSRAVAREPERAIRLLRCALDAFTKDATFPAWYPSLFERRFRFGVARLAVQAEPVDLATLARMLELGGGWLDLMRRLPTPVLRPVVLAALTLRFRPTSLIGVFGTALARRLELFAAEPVR